MQMDSVGGKEGNTMGWWWWSVYYYQYDWSQNSPDWQSGFISPLLNLSLTTMAIKTVTLFQDNPFLTLEKLEFE